MSTFDKHDLSGFIGKHLVYTYDNGWNYEIYVKNGTTLDYRIHSGIVANRWVKDQQAYIVRVGESIYKISWIMNNPEKTVCFQNDHIPLMVSYREAGPAYPTEVIDEFATITFVRDCGADNDEVINCPANELPDNFPANL